MQIGMTATYLALIRAGRRTLEQVPETLREAVKEALADENADED